MTPLACQIRPQGQPGGQVPSQGQQGHSSSVRISVRILVMMFSSPMLTESPPRDYTSLTALTSLTPR